MTDSTPDPITPPMPANTLAVGVAGKDLDDKVVPRKQVISWAFWDWATQPFNSVILTFVFVPLFLVKANFLPDEIAALPDDDPLKVSGLADLTAGYGLAGIFAGLLIFLLAPVLGQRADASGRKKRWLIVFTFALALLQFSLFFIHADPTYFWYGAIVLALGQVIAEIAGVNYNAMLTQVSTRKTIGRVSGLGWGLGYLGGIVALVIVVVLDTFSWFGLDTSDGLAYRLIAVGAGVWTILFSLPIILNVPEQPAGENRPPRVPFFQSYVILVKDVAELFRKERPTFWFLLSSAVYRDGLAGVFAYGGILAAIAFGFSDNEVIIFGIAANVVAGISTILAGRADDHFGPKRVILFALFGLVAMAIVLFAFHQSGDIVFWVCGLTLSAFVGPAQAASRSLLARVAPEGRQGEIFGLYATTGRVASFLAPTLWTLAIVIFGATIFGVLGIGLVLLVGAIMLLFVKVPKFGRSEI